MCSIERNNFEGLEYSSYQPPFREFYLPLACFACWISEVHFYEE